MLFLRFEEISYAVGYLATLTFPLLYLKPWQEHGTYNTQRKMVLFHSCKNAQTLTHHTGITRRCLCYFQAGCADILTVYKQLLFVLRFAVKVGIYGE